MRVLLMMIATLFLVGCVNVEGMPDFENMSDEELFNYNADRPLAQMIVCTDEPRSFSRVRRRTCGTVEQMYGTAEAAARLGVLHAPDGVATAE